MSTFITRLDGTGSGPRLAVKDIIDIAGVPTTAGSRALERIARAATEDAACLAGARAADARIVGKANLHEFAMLPLGTNPWFGTPTNPLDPALIPGGSSSGSAVAVGADEADVAYGSDTGGSIRVPAACCGVTGLKTTYGRIPLDGVWPLAPAFDTVGPLARDVAGVELGMQLLEPGFAAATTPARRIGRLRTTGDPAIEAAVDRALRRAGFEVVPVQLDLDFGTNSWTPIFVDQAHVIHHRLAERYPDDVGQDIHGMLALFDLFRPGVDEARVNVGTWKDALRAAFADVELLALPTMPIFPPRVDAIPDDPTEIAIEITRFTSLFNAAGTPATAQPVPADGSRLPASLQLVGPWGSEELLVATAREVEATARRV